ncbi:DUF4268 domain-containing protein [Endozoicomonas acroporae]|uniref:DUF4268 domain-containing protein n=1 Tax=Endozoicomonas acroporae TaxID=1701104 RepID=UPI000C785335|nr:DUF4268 domain-containing protein [Endozoicomonas acroporae]
MYLINKQANAISQLTQRSFSELGFRERDHLQEWIAKEPSTLGEDLLIIQKEFDGFDDTRERLDLLALDKSGNLVVIENKLDDTGRDVIWQALKYASYCSNLSKTQIVNIYQAYLDRYHAGGNARENLSEFFEQQDFEELVFNPGNQQRIIFIAANFRKEVTSTALWLLSHKIRIQCFKATPYSMGDQLFLSIDQIIPVKEAEDYMVGIAEKEQEEKSTQVELQNRHHIRLAYWEQFLDAIKGSDCNLYNNVNPVKDHWLSSGSGCSGVPYQCIFMKNGARVQLSISRSSQEENKYIFDRLLKKKDDIEAIFGEELRWSRMDDKKTSYITLERDFDGYNKAVWPEMINWMVQHIHQLEKAISQPLKESNQTLKTFSALPSSPEA